MDKIINKLNEAFLPHNTECDGAGCMGCWKDVVREAIKMLEAYRSQPVQVEGLPSAVDLKNYLRDNSTYGAAMIDCIKIMDWLSPYLSAIIAKKDETIDIICNQRDYWKNNSVLLKEGTDKKLLKYDKDLTKERAEKEELRKEVGDYKTASTKIGIQIHELKTTITNQSNEIIKLDAQLSTLRKENEQLKSKAQ